MSMSVLSPVQTAKVRTQSDDVVKGKRQYLKASCPVPEVLSSGTVQDCSAQSRRSVYMPDSLLA